MAAIPTAVLSERLQDAIQNRRLISAVFLTYKLDPAFFEQEVIPLLVDVPLAHAPAIRLVQLEDALRELAGEIAVYFDSNGLAVSDDGSAKLDVRRIPVRMASGIFHAKNVFALVEQDADDPEAAPTRALIVASLSANLTRAGWWENVEAAHVEEIAEGDRTRLRDDLIYFLEGTDSIMPSIDRGDGAEVAAVWAASCCLNRFENRAIAFTQKFPSRKGHFL